MRPTATPSSRPPANLRVARSGVHGYGLFTREPVARGARLIEYFGERITKRESRRRDARQLARRAAGRLGCIYTFELNQRHDLDGDLPGNLARRINHSCAPNCEAQVHQGRIWIVALRDLGAAEELTFDYGFDYAEWRNHPCACGSIGCVGFIVNASQRWRVRRALRRPASGGKK